MIETDPAGRPVLRVPGDASLAEAPALRRALIEAVAASDAPLAVDLAPPLEGMIGLQLALSAAATLEAAGRLAGFAEEAPALLSEAIR